MSKHTLEAISPIDGRYLYKVDNLSKYFSEHALFKYRVFVEIEYFLFLSEKVLKSKISKSKKEQIKKIYQNFNIKDSQRIKTIEKKTNHDIKAVEYFIKEKFAKIGLHKKSEFIHFGLTSQDINNTSVPLLLKDFMTEVFYKEIKSLIKELEKISKKWNKTPMMARTHGQPASPTLLGKEMYVFVNRLKKELDYTQKIPFLAKFGGATGNFNAHTAAFPKVDWHKFGDNFVEQKLKIQRIKYSTQIDDYDNLARLFDSIKRTNIILLDFSKDIWSYISFDYFKQKLLKNEIGSSTMPHKINPIDFENAEGNLGLGNAMFNHLSSKLPISRLQRDLTDSTVLRNIGLPFAYSIISYKSLKKGINKLIINKIKIKEDLNNNWILVSEAIQTILRREGYNNPYEELKKLTRINKKIGEKEIKEFVEKLKIKEKTKQEIKEITPFNYIGQYI